MSWQLHVPVRDPDEVVDVKAISELPAHLDGEDAVIARELLIFVAEAASPDTCTVGMVADVIEDFDSRERKTLLKALRKRAGLPDPDDVDAQRRFEFAQGRTRPPVRLGIMPGGALVDLNEREADDARERAAAASRAAQHEARLAERAVEARLLDEHHRAKAERVRRELPPGVPG